MIFRQSDHAVTEPEALGSGCARNTCQHGAVCLQVIPCRAGGLLDWMPLPKELVRLRRPATFKVHVVVSSKRAGHSPPCEQTAGVRCLVKINVRAIRGCRHQGQSQVEGATVAGSSRRLYPAQNRVESPCVTCMLQNTVR